MRSSIFSSRAVVFLAVLVVGVLCMDRLSAAALGQVTRSSEFRLSSLYDGRADTDVAIFGNSRAVHTFYAPELGAGACPSATNFAYNGLSMRAIEALIRDYLDRNEPPALVVVELSAVYSPGQGDEQLTPFMESGSALREYLLGQRDSVVPWDRLFSSYRFNSTLILRTANYLGSDDQTWINRLSPIRQPGLPPGEGEPFRQYVPTLESLEALERIAALLDGSDIEMLPVVAPYHTTVEVAVETPYAWIDQVKQRLPADVELLDLSTVLPGDDEFQDFMHLNIVGARAIQGQLNEEIARRC